MHRIEEVYIMAPASTATREAPAASPRVNPAPGATHSSGRPIPARASRTATDDEILGLDSSSADANDSFVGAQHAWRDEAHSSKRLATTRSAGATQPAAHAASAIAEHESDDPWRDDDASAASPSSSQDRVHDADAAQAAEPEALRATLDANPELRRAWDDAQAYRETFSSPEEARAATTLLADLDRMDALFFSRRPEDHAELARAVASLDPAAFASLAQAMAGLATESQRHGDDRLGNRGLSSAPPSSLVIPRSEATRNLSSSAARGVPQMGESFPSTSSGTAANSEGSPSMFAGRSGATPLQPAQTPQASQSAGPTSAQTEFFHATNAAAVEGVLDAIQSQVERLLPDGVSKSARNRVVGEIYRELDTTLRSNRQLAQQMRDAFRSGALDADHQRALVSLVTGRARQALPGVAKRVLNEWTSTIVAANQDRRTRQHAAERRVDIAGSGGTGSDGPRSMTPREIDYRRMSDADILNL
jgi:hypothetical protein